MERIGTCRRGPLAAQVGDGLIDLLTNTRMRAAASSGEAAFLCGS